MIIIITMTIIVDCISSQHHYHYQWMMAPRICKEGERERNFLVNFTWYFRPSCIIRFFFFLLLLFNIDNFKKHHLSHTIIHIEISFSPNSISSSLLLLLFAHATPFFFSFYSIHWMFVCLFVCHQSKLWIIILNEWMNEWCTLHLIPNIRFIFTFIHSVTV